MGSSKPPNLDLPFGYSLDTPSNFPFPSPTAPAPGPSLLDDNESKFLDSFFDGVSQDHFDFNFFAGAPERADMGLGWEELPPAFMGTTSSFGQQPQLNAHNLIDPNFDALSLHTPTGPSLSQPTSADVLEAASLLQNGSVGRPQSTLQGSLFPPQDMPTSPPNGQIRPQYAQPQSFSAAQGRSTSGEFPPGSYYADMFLGRNSETPARPRNSNQKVDIRWGSDTSFAAQQGFTAPVHQDTEAELEREHLQIIETALKLDLETASADSSHPTSPIQPFKPQVRSKSNGQASERIDPDSRPAKRRKSKFNSELDEVDRSQASAQDAKKRRQIKKESLESIGRDADASSKRRKSSGTPGKNPRENLTEDQKRENHIRSEQKRRTLIREGFEDLGELVPGLNGGGFSKSAVLVMAADWLEDLLTGNEILRARLEQMERGR